ncbi:MAG: type IV pilus biogenesis protein PilM [Sedimentibacter sp.]
MVHTLSISSNQISYINGKANKKKIIVYKDANEELQKDIINNGIINNENELIEVLKNFSAKNFKNKKVNVIIDSSNILFREISVPVARKKVLYEMIKNEIINSIGNLEDYLFDYIILNKDEKKYNILVFIIKKQIITDYLEVLTKSQIKYKSINISSNCIAKLFGFIEKKEKTFIVLDINLDSINLYLIDQSCCVWNKNIKLSLVNFKKNNALNIAFEEISDHINRTLQFQKTRNKLNEIKNIYIIGSIYELPELLRTIETNTGLTSIKFNSFGLIKCKKKFINVKNYINVLGSLVKRG